jgi:hypothetical protein
LSTALSRLAATIGQASSSTDSSSDSLSLSLALSEHLSTLRDVPGKIALVGDGDVGEVVPRFVEVRRWSPA